MNPFSLTLVLAQFGFIALILSPANALFNSSSSSIAGLVFIGLSIILAVWAFATMKLANFSVLPEPVSNGMLITSGPYRYIRHPMYSAVIAACLGAAISHGGAINWIWLTCLCVVLAIKIRREEAQLLGRYQAYEQYSKQTHALVPGVY